MRAALAGLGTVIVATGLSAGTGGRTIDVPGDAATVQAAIVVAEPGDVILLAPGVYPGDVVVPEDSPGITIRGSDRNAVVFDGEGEREEAITVLADGVALENMTAHHFDGNAFAWYGVEGFAGRYLTVWNVEYYGIYAIDSRDGVIEDSYVSWAADAGFYIGECAPCDTTLQRVRAVRSAIGYSGTNANGVILRDSEFVENGTGIMPNSYNEEDHPPQAEMTISGNLVAGSGTVPTPNEGPLGGYTGMGIAIAGGVGNRVEGNTVIDSAEYGIALYPTLQREGPPWAPADNVIEGNDVTGSATADLAVSTGSGPGNCFAGNTFGSSRPAAIETAGPCPGGLAEGDPSVGAVLAVPPGEALDRAGDRPDWREGEPPPPQPQMLGVDAPGPTETAAPDDDGAGTRGVAWFPFVLLAVLTVAVLRWRRSS
jgi:hypothetical protein